MKFSCMLAFLFENYGNIVLLCVTNIRRHLSVCPSWQEAIIYPLSPQLSFCCSQWGRKNYNEKTICLGAELKFILMARRNVK